MKHSYIIFALLVSGCVETTKQASPSMPLFRVVYSDFLPLSESDYELFDKAEFFAVYIDIPDSLKIDSSSYLRVAQYLVEKNNCNKRDVCMFGFWDEWVLTSDIKFNIPLAEVHVDNMIAYYNDGTEDLYICELEGC